VLAPMIEREVSDAIFFKNGSVVETFPCSSRTTRGNPVAGLCLDELGFFTSVEDGEQAAAEVHRALTPSLAQFGNDRRLLMCSSPNGANFFKERYDVAVEQAAALEGEGPGVPVAALKLATWEVRSDIRQCVTLAGDLSPQEITGAAVGLDVGYRKDRSAAVVLGYDHKNVASRPCGVWGRTCSTRTRRSGAPSSRVHSLVMTSLRSLLLASTGPLAVTRSAAGWRRGSGTQPRRPVGPALEGCTDPGFFERPRKEGR
jgi:hypothetical protein